MNIKSTIMNREELNRLLENYYNGTSTEKEEEVLRRFFSEEEVPQGFEAEKAVFSYYSSSLSIPEPSIDFENRIIKGINESESKQKHGKNRNLSIWLMSTAAGLLIMVGSYFFFTDKDGMQDTFSDPEIAYTETLKILMNVSAQLNKGTEALEPVGIINDVKSKRIEKKLKNLKYIQTALDLTRISDEKK
jgi:hypothetical protein